MKQLIENLRDNRVEVSREECAAALENLTAELVDVKAEQLARFEALAKYTVDLEAERDRLKESATEWNRRYRDACQQHADRQTNLGHQIVALEAERDALKTHNTMLRVCLKNVIKVADRKTDEFDAAKAALEETK